MNEIDKLRCEIDCVDDEISRLFAERTELCRKIGEIKKSSGENVLCCRREEQIVSRLCGKYPQYADGLTALYEEIFRLSRAVQGEK